jgi:hypothetical protein
MYVQLGEGQCEHDAVRENYGPRGFVRAAVSSLQRHAHIDSLCCEQNASTPFLASTLNDSRARVLRVTNETTIMVVC